MAQIDTNIYGLLGRGVKSVQDYDQEAQATEAAKLGNLLNRSKIDEYQTGVQEKNALRSYLSGGANLSTPEGVQGLYRVAPTQAGSILKDQAAMLKEGAQARSANATASAAEWELKLKKANTAISDIASLGSPQDAVASVQKHLQLGDIDEQKAQAMLSSIPQDPAQFPEWRKSTLMRLLDAKSQIELSKPVIQTRNTGGSTDTLAIDPLTGAVKVTNTVQNTNSPDAVLGASTTIRGQNLTNARGVEANNLKAAEIAQGGKPPPGYRWNPDGSLQAIPGGPGDKLPEAQQKQVIGVQNLSNAIKEYRDALKTFKAGDALNPNTRATMGTKYNNMLLQAKEAYNLGVLNGPDFEILQSVVTDPRSVKGVITSNDALDTQAAELDRIMGGIASTASQTRPRGATPAQPAANSAPSGWKYVGTVK